MILNEPHIASVSFSSQRFICRLWRRGLPGNHNLDIAWQEDIFKARKYPRDVVRVNQRDQCGRKQFVAVLLINAFDSQL